MFVLFEKNTENEVCVRERHFHWWARDREVAREPESGCRALLPCPMAHARRHARAVSCARATAAQTAKSFPALAAAASDGGEGRPRGQSALAAVTAPRPRLARPNRGLSGGRVGLRLGGNSWLLELRLFLFGPKLNLARARVCVALQALYDLEKNVPFTNMASAPWCFGALGLFFARFREASETPKWLASSEVAYALAGSEKSD